MGLEAALQVGRGGVVDGGRAEEARGAHPDVEATEGVEELVEQGYGVFFVGDVEGVGDELGVWVCGGEGLGEGGVGVGAGGLIAGCWGLLEERDC